MLRTSRQEGNAFPHLLYRRYTKKIYAKQAANGEIWVTRKTSYQDNPSKKKKDADKIKDPRRDPNEGVISLVNTEGRKYISTTALPVWIFSMSDISNVFKYGRHLIEIKPNSLIAALEEALKDGIRISRVDGKFSSNILCRNKINKRLPFNFSFLLKCVLIDIGKREIYSQNEWKKSQDKSIDHIILGKKAKTEKHRKEIENESEWILALYFKLPEENEMIGISHEEVFDFLHDDLEKIGINLNAISLRQSQSALMRLLRLILIFPSL